MIKMNLHLNLLSVLSEFLSITEDQTSHDGSSRWKCVLSAGAITPAGLLSTFLVINLEDLYARTSATNSILIGT